jgi:hypothetical protein
MCGEPDEICLPVQPLIAQAPCTLVLQTGLQATLKLGLAPRVHIYWEFARHASGLLTKPGSAFARLQAEAVARSRWTTWKKQALRFSNSCGVKHYI